MRSWVQGKYPQYQIPSETHHFAKLAFALAMHEVDEDVINRQRAEWMDDLLAMQAAQTPPTSAIDAGIVLPEGVQITPKLPKR